MYESSGYPGLANYYCLYKIFRMRMKNASSVIFSLIYGAGTFYLLYIWLRDLHEGYDMSFLTLILVVYLIIAFPLLFPDLRAAIRAYRIERKKPEGHIRYMADRIRHEREDVISDIFYSEVTEIVEIRDTFYLLLGDYQIFFEDKKRLTGADPEAFGAFLSEKCSLPVRRFSSVLAYRKE